MMCSDFLKELWRSSIKLYSELWLNGINADMYLNIPVFYECKHTLWGSSYRLQDITFPMVYWNYGASCQLAVNLVAYTGKLSNESVAYTSVYPQSP